METYSIWTEGLTKTFDAGRKANPPVIMAVDHVDLRVAPGEFYGFLGPNGAGKSTTIKMLTGLLRPTSGVIRVAGFDMAQYPLDVKRVIGVLPEDLNLYERLTAMEFLMFAAQMYGISKVEARKRTNELLHLIEMEEAGSKLIVDFSMGMKKKVALAGAMIHAPRVLFLDEPFNGIDAISARSIRDVLHRMTQLGTTIFFSSHVMEVVEKLCTRIAIITGGKIVAEGTMDMLRVKADTPEGSLEDIFVRLVKGATHEPTSESSSLGGADDFSWLNAGKHDRSAAAEQEAP